jgi:hypothetical protein
MVLKSRIPRGINHAAIPRRKPFRQIETWIPAQVHTGMTESKANVGTTVILILRRLWPPIHRSLKSCKFSSGLWSRIHRGL